MGAYSLFLKKKLNFSRFMGFLSSACAVVLIVFYFLKFIDPWIGVIDISYLIGVTFTSNVTCQDIKVGSPWQKLNAFMAVVFYLIAIGLLVYSLVSGQISL